jgi:LPS-assembly protein
MRSLAKLLGVLALWAAALAAGPARAAEPAVLVADAISVAGTNLLIAQGHVEVIRGSTRLTASRIVYDRHSGRLTIDGPIRLADGQRVVILADQAQLSADLREGILTSARMVLDDQLQIAAVEINRVDGRYTQLSKTVASSCQVCAGHPVPLWSIRARRVIHDQQEQQVYFDDAQFRVLDVPVFYVPRLRLPDPSLKRATGFLVPRIVTNSALGVGAKIPYFLAIGPSRDLTFTPYVSTQTRTLELRYRQALASGRLSFSGAASQDNLLTGETRAYVFGEGEFDIGQGFSLAFNLRLASDAAYLLTYDYADFDRLISDVGVSRYGRDEAISASVSGIRTLRDSEIPIADQLPGMLIDASWERRFFPAALGGELRFALSSAAVARQSAADILGRDMGRISAEIGWSGQWVTDGGLVTEARLGLLGDLYAIAQDSSYDPVVARAIPSGMLTLRYPLARVTGGGAHQLLEPIVALAWSRSLGGTVPNEDSLLNEFDETNLTALSRFAGHDAQEEGARAAIGVHFMQDDPGGLSFGVTIGQVFRSAADAGFTQASGLAGPRSDMLAALRLDLGSSLSLTSRSVFSPAGVDKSETRFAWNGARAGLGASYLWMLEEPAQGRPDPINELTLDGHRDFGAHWSALGNLRYDLTAERAQTAGLGLTYRNECVSFDLSLSRRFTSSTSLTPTTDVSVQVALNGIGNDGRAFRGTCR